MDSLQKVEEEQAKYYVNNENDKIFRTILDNKEEAVNFINDTLKIKISKDEIEKYNSSFINNIFQNREADVVYKIKNKNVLFLIEHQTKIDYLMPYRILEYQLAIMKSVLNDNVKNKPSAKFPLVIPIVLYTHNKKWDADTYFEKLQETYNDFNIKLSNYYLVDINNYTEEELLNREDFLSKMMLLEKAKNSKELVEFIKKVIPKTKKDDIELLKRIVALGLRKKLTSEDIQKLLQIMEGDGEDMLAFLDMLEKENQMYINIGKTEGIKEGRLEEKVKIIKNMLNEKLSIDKISKITGVKKEEIEKMKEK